MSDLKKVVAEFADIAKTCPENLQQKCFELLLSDYLEFIYKVVTYSSGTRCAY
jgi:hypothetical protein